MPASVFSEAELARLASFPEEIPSDDLIRAFTLTGRRPKPRSHEEYGKRRSACDSAALLLEPRKPRGSRPDASGRAVEATKLPALLPDLEPPANPTAYITSGAQVDRLRIERELGFAP